MANLTVKSETKEQAGNMNVSEDFYDAFNREVTSLLEDAKQRARDNNRKTIQPRDL